MFWSDVGLVPKIEVANLDGSDSKVLIGSELFWPAGLAIDTITDRLYWCDMKENEVETAFINGTDRRVVLDSTRLKGQFSEPYSIDVFGDYLYIVTKKGVAFKWNKFGHGLPTKLVSTGVPGARIKVYHKARQTHPNGKSWRCIVHSQLISVENSVLDWSDNLVTIFEAKLTFKCQFGGNTFFLQNFRAVSSDFHY